jgi:hypothetical protein
MWFAESLRLAQAAPQRKRGGRTLRELLQLLPQPAGEEDTLEGRLQREREEAEQQGENVRPGSDHNPIQIRSNPAPFYASRAGLPQDGPSAQTLI